MMSTVGCGSLRSSMAGRHVAFQSGVAPKPARILACPVQASGKVCELTGTKRNKANSVSFSNKKTRKFQEANLQEKKVFWERGQRWVKLKLSTRAIKTIEKNGLEAVANEAGVDLWSLKYEDARPARLKYLAENKMKVPVAENPRAIKNKEKIAASKKEPKYPVYEEGGRIVWIRPGMEEMVFGKKEEAAAPAAPAAEAQQLKVTVSQ